MKFVKWIPGKDFPQDLKVLKSGAILCGWKNIYNSKMYQEGLKEARKLILKKDRR